MLLLEIQIHTINFLTNIDSKCSIIFIYAFYFSYYAWVVNVKFKLVFNFCNTYQEFTAIYYVYYIDMP